jgi:DNA-binding MarR family transcriptional regulator
MPDQQSLSSEETTADLAELPPSAKLVAKTLEYEGDSTQSELAESTLLPPRTVRYALTELEENDLVTSRISFQDARQRIYSLESGDS